MALSDVQLCNRALIKIGATPLGGFDDGTPQAEIAETLYATTRDALLSAHAWTFATAQAALTTTLASPPTADFAHAFQLPADCLRVLSAGSGVRGRGLAYRIVGTTLQTDRDEVVITYVYRAAESAFPPFFDAALIARLAAEFCLPITENTSRAEMYFTLAERAFREAKLIDSQQDTPQAIEDFVLVEARS